MRNKNMEKARRRIKRVRHAPRKGRTAKPQQSVGLTWGRESHRKKFADKIRDLMACFSEFGLAQLFKV